MEIINYCGSTQGVDDGVQEEQTYGNDDDYVHKVIFADFFHKKLSYLTHIKPVFIFVGDKGIEI